MVASHPAPVRGARPVLIGRVSGWRLVRECAAMTKTTPARLALTAACLVVLLDVATPRAADDGQRLLTLDHYVRVTSNVPATAGQLM